MSENDTIRPVNYDEDQPFDVHAHSGRYAMRKLILTLLALLAIALLIFFMYQPGKRDRNDPVIISPDAKALKVLPEETDETTPRDPEIYNAGKDSSIFPETVDVREVPIIGTPIKPEEVIEIKPPVKVKPIEPVITKPEPIYNSDYVVQVASLKSRAEAERSWAQISSKHNFLSSRPYDILQIDLGAKGIFYRLRADGFSNKSEASNFCNRLKANGQSCLVTTR